MELACPNIKLVVEPIAVDASFQHSPEVANLVQLGPVPNCKRDDIRPKVHKINLSGISIVTRRAQLVHVHPCSNRFCTSSAVMQN